MISVGTERLSVLVLSPKRDITATTATVLLNSFQSTTFLKVQPKHVKLPLLTFCCKDEKLLRLLLIKVTVGGLSKLL